MVLYGDIRYWDTSRVTNMTGLFSRDENPYLRDHYCNVNITGDKCCRNITQDYLSYPQNISSLYCGYTYSCQAFLMKIYNFGILVV